MRREKEPGAGSRRPKQQAAADARFRLTAERPVVYNHNTPRSYAILNGFITHLSYFPDDDLTIAILGNLGSAPSSWVTQMLARVTLGVALPVVKDLPIAPTERNRVVGSYQLTAGVVTVREEGEQLVLVVPNMLPQRLRSQGDGSYIPVDQADWVVRFTPATGTAEEIVIGAGGSALRGKRNP